jgi:hypothetical protein
MSSTESGESWSQWLDFDKSNVSSIPERAGVFGMHTSMKILFIGSTQNLRNSLLESLSTLCIDKTKRFRYMITKSPDEVKAQLLKEYIEKHNGEFPLCMERTS